MPFANLALASSLRMWQSGFMKNRNMREMEKHWSEQQKKAAKPSKAAPKTKPSKAAAPKKESRGDVN
jgi:hypothetical protein